MAFTPYRFIIGWPSYTAPIGWTRLGPTIQQSEVHVEGASITNGWNRGGSCTITLNKNQLPNVTVPDPVTGFDFVKRMTPLRNTLWIIRDGVPLWAGLIWDIAANSSSQTVQLTAEEFVSYFDHQNLVTEVTGTTSHSAFAGNLANSTATSVLTSLLVSEGNAALVAPFPMTMGTTIVTASTAIYTPRWYSYENRKVGDLIRELASYADDIATQTVTITGTPTGGTFTLTYQGQTTTAIAFNGNFAAVETPLNALSSIGAGGVTVTGGPGPGTPWVCTFTAVAATPLTATGSFTGGTSPAIAVTLNSLGHTQGFEWRQTISQVDDVTLQAKVSVWAPRLVTPTFTTPPVVSWGDGTLQTAQKVDWLFTARTSGTRVKVSGFGERGQQTTKTLIAASAGADGMPLVDFTHENTKIRGQFNVNAKAAQIIEVLGVPQFTMRATVVVSELLTWDHVQPGYKIRCYVRDAGMEFSPILRIISRTINIDPSGTELIDLELAPDTASFA